MFAKRINKPFCFVARLDSVYGGGTGGFHGASPCLVPAYEMDQDPGMTYITSGYLVPPAYPRVLGVKKEGPGLGPSLPADGYGLLHVNGQRRLEDGPGGIPRLHHHR